MNNKNTNSIATEICVNPKQFACDICQKEFFKKILYLVHSITHLLPENFNCHECQEGFSHILSLDKHLEVHDDVAHIVCHVCQKEFFDIDSLNEHARVHNGESTNLLLLVKQEIDIDETPEKIYNNRIYSSSCDERSEKCATENPISSNNVKNLFRCDRCKGEFHEMHDLDEHCKKFCIKKELDSDKCKKIESVILTSAYYRDDDNEPLSYYNESSVKYILGSDSLQNLFKCDRCKKEFLDRHHLKEHNQNVCVKKELDYDDEFVSLTSVPSFFHASENVNGTSSENFLKCNNVNIFTVQAQQNVKRNVCPKNFTKVNRFVCKVCQKVFSKKCSLTIHFPTHSSKKTFSCHLCKKKFILKCLLNAHLRTHTVKKVFCGVCQKGFPSKEKCFEHVYTHAIVETFTCNICQMTFSEKSSVKKHYLSHTAETNTACEIKHGPSDRLQKVFRCDKCKKEFSQKLLLEEHYQNNCIKKEYNSDKIEELESETFTPVDSFHVSDNDREPFSSYYYENSRKYGNASKEKLSEHVRTHARVKSFACNICEAIFSQKSLLEKHLNHRKEQKLETNVTCEVCQKTFYSKTTLNEHKHIHSGSFPHVCDICSKGFARLDRLKRHYQTHSKVSKKKLSSKKALNTRKSTHSVSRSYVCDVCSKEFTRRDHLERHCRIHVEQNPLECKICGKSYKNKRNLTKHQLTHQLK